MSNFERKKASIVIVYHSRTGHTALLAESIREGALEVAGVEAHLMPVTAEEINWKILADADAIIFGCPTHLGSASAAFKGFMDASVAAWFQGQWRNKIAAGFTNSANFSGDKLSTLMQLSIFAAQHGMLWIGLDVHGDPQESNKGLNRLGSYLGAMGMSDARRPDGGLPAGDRRTAFYLGNRVAQASLRWRQVTHHEEGSL